MSSPKVARDVQVFELTPVRLQFGRDLLALSYDSIRPVVWVVQIIWPVFLCS